MNCNESKTCCCMELFTPTIHTMDYAVWTQNLYLMNVFLGIEAYHSEDNETCKSFYVPWVHDVEYAIKTENVMLLCLIAEYDSKINGHPDSYNKLMKVSDFIIDKKLILHNKEKLKNVNDMVSINEKLGWGEDINLPLEFSTNCKLNSEINDYMENKYVSEYMEPLAI